MYDTMVRPPVRDISCGLSPHTVGQTMVLPLHILEGSKLHYKRRYDLEPNRTECIWIKLNNNTKHVLHC